MKSFDDYTAVFFWNFKRMDNTNYNFRIFESLCYISAERGNELLYKPLILIVSSIIECILYDFVKRVTEHSRELIPNLEVESIFDTRGKLLDDFQPLIEHIKKNNLLRVMNGDSLYDDLDVLRKLRNRIHIQNKLHQLDEDEYKIWIKRNVKQAGYILERVCEVLCHVYPRPDTHFMPMTEFPRPWLNI